MMDFTPDAERVRAAAIDFGYITEEQFDRWLAKVIAEAEMKGWREGYEEGRTDGSNHG